MNCNNIDPDNLTSKNPSLLLTLAALALISLLNENLVHDFNIMILNDNSSVIRQKGKSQNGCFKKAKHAKISEKQTFLTP